MIATTRMVGASTCNASLLSGVFTSTSLKNPAPKKMSSAPIPPDTRANKSVHLKILYAAFACPAAIRADTSFDTASGRLKEEISSTME